MDTLKIGTHNSMTYLKPSKWWLWLFRFAYKCQSLTIEEQLANGIRIFDLRIRLNKKGEWIFAHGLAEFKGISPIDTLNLINNFAKEKNEKYKVRLMWETKDTDNEEEAKIFTDLCFLVETTFTNIQFFGGTSIATWKNWYNFHPYGDNPEKRECWEYKTEQFVSSLSSFGVAAIWPWLYTTILKKKLRKKAAESQAEIVLLDFISKKELTK